MSWRRLTSAFNPLKLLLRQLQVQAAGLIWTVKKPRATCCPCHPFLLMQLQLKSQEHLTQV
jgi:hypothetical protein